MKKNTLIKPIIPIAAALLLSACNGGSSDPNSKQPVDPVVDTTRTYLASELTNIEGATFTVAEQPSRGRLIVSPDRKKLTFEPLNHFAYLGKEEIAEVKVNVTLNGDGKAISKELNFNVLGDGKNPCENKKAITLTANMEWPDYETKPYVDIPADTCVALDATNFGKDGNWVSWESKYGSYRDILAVTGVNHTSSAITFMPPANGQFTLSWCPASGAECTANYYINSQKASTTRKLNTQLVKENAISGETMKLSVNNLAEGQDLTGATYRWLITDVTDTNLLLTDITSTENHIEFTLPTEHKNYSIMVIVDDNQFQLNGDFSTKVGDTWKYLSTVGNYQSISDNLFIRDPDSNLKPPTAIVEVNGQRYLGGDFIEIKAPKGTQLQFDATMSEDPNGDPLTYWWHITEFMKFKQTDGTYTYTLDHDWEYLTFCADDGFPWSWDDHVCVSFYIIAE